MPDSAIKVEVSSDYDYYRPITIKYLSNSFNTEKGWKYRYTTVTQGTLSSLEHNEFKFSSSTLSKLRIIVENHDNEPLEYSDCKLWDYERVLIALFTEKANYFMYYGNPAARKPVYDLKYFADQIPGQLTNLQLGDEQEIKSETIDEKRTLFENKAWLWAVLLVIIALLANFSMKMIKKH